MKDLRQTSNYSVYMEAIGWEIDKLNDVYCFSKKIPVIGSFIKIQRGEKVIGEGNLATLIDKRRAFIVLIEPLSTKQENYYIESLKFRKMRSSSLPSKTIHIDLKKSEGELLSEMHYKTRYNVKVAKKRGVSIKLSRDIDKFADFWQMSAKKRGMFLSLKKHIKSIYKSFGKNSKIFLAFRENKLLGGVLTISAKDICYYMYAASTQDGNNFFAPTLLAWNAIKHAKKTDKKLFDFEGIYDKRYPLKSWKGFSRFKRSFGGKEVEFPLSVRKYFLPL